jgi:hypothetical protein
MCPFAGGGLQASSPTWLPAFVSLLYTLCGLLGKELLERLVDDLGIGFPEESREFLAVENYAFFHNRL